MTEKPNPVVVSKDDTGIPGDGNPPNHLPGGKPDPTIFDPVAYGRDFYAHPMSAYGRCSFMYNNGNSSNSNCPPNHGLQTAFLLTLPYSYLSDYAVNVVGIVIPPTALTVQALVPLIMIGLNL
jgi:hypothetical protein